MSTTIRVGVENGAIGTIDTIRERAKALSADLKDAQREIQTTQRMGQTVTKEMTARYREIQGKYQNAREMVKETAKAERAAEEASRNFSKGDVRKALKQFHGVEHLMHGEVNVHSIHAATHLLEHTPLGKTSGFMKFADSLSNVSGPLMVAKMVLDYEIKKYEKETEKIKHSAEFQSTIIDKAKSMGITGEVRKRIVDAIDLEETFNPKNKKLAETEEGRKEIAKKKEEGAMKRLAQVNEARAYKEEFGITAEDVNDLTYKGRDANGKVIKTTDEEWNKRLDEMIADRLSNPKGQRVIANHNERERLEHEKELQEHRHMQADPLYAAARNFMKHEEKMRAEIGFQVRHKRYSNPNPVDF